MTQQAKFCDECGARLTRPNSKFCSAYGSEVGLQVVSQRSARLRKDKSTRFERYNFQRLLMGALVFHYWTISGGAGLCVCYL